LAPAVVTTTALQKAEPYDLIILGGGITGAGIARDATLRGLKVALFEKNDFGSGTSSKSSKLIHGGLRYLEQGEIGLVFESVSERRVQQKVAPHLVRPQPFLVPIFKGSKPGLEVMNIGLWIYDSLALFRAPRMHKTFRGAKAGARLEPALQQEGLRGIIEYYDCATDDARLVLENILDARAMGADCRNYTEIVRLIRAGGSATGRVEGVVVRDVSAGSSGGREEELRARCVVIAAGAWTDEAVRRFEVPVGRDLLRRTKGVHVVFPRERLPVQRAITLISPVDGRVMFAIPWRERTVVGTTDTDFQGKADEVHADAADAQYLCDSANGYFPKANLSPADIIATWAGLRPLIRTEEAEDESDVSREHEIFVRDDGLVIIAGGKLTTYRRMAMEAVRKAIKWLKGNDETFNADRLVSPGTKGRPLPGADGLDEPDLAAVNRLGAKLAAEHGLDPATAAHLAGIYGTRAAILAASIAGERRLGERMNADLPYVWAEVDFAVEHDLARTVDDILSRRAPLLLVGRDQGLDVCERVADRIATLRPWPAGERERQLAAYRKVVADSRRFRTPT
jgi:glycerol-3-phosphate dehydrogenase